jgi:hypothetical protein
LAFPGHQNLDTPEKPKRAPSHPPSIRKAL